MIIACSTIAPDSAAGVAKFGQNSAKKIINNVIVFYVQRYFT